MSSGLPSDEVAEDYKNSLEDLTTNDKFQISNLTVIAKENTEHAMAISRVLENHIRTVGAFSCLLPTLYHCRIPLVHWFLTRRLQFDLSIIVVKSSSRNAL